MKKSYVKIISTLLLISSIFLSFILISKPKKAIPILKNMTFHIGGFNSSFQIELKDSTFIYSAKSISCTSKDVHTTEVEGTFIQEKEKVFFSPQKQFTKNYQDSTSTIYNPKDVYQLNGVFEIWQIDSIINLIQIDSKTCMNLPLDVAPKNGFTMIAQNINYNGKSGIGGWSTCKKKECPIFDTTIKSQFPEAWKDYILDSPIEAKIIEKEALTEDHHLFSPYVKYNVTIDKGSNQGLKKGMQLSTADQARIYLYQIDKNSSKGYFHFYQAKEYLEKNKSYYSYRPK